MSVDSLVNTILRVSLPSEISSKSYLGETYNAQGIFFHRLFNGFNLFRP
jgi:hypothetical protein